MIEYLTEQEVLNMDTNYIIETKNLTKQYGSQKSVADLNIHVKRGRIYGLLGRNGAGKTTTMKMLLGLTKPTSGEVKIWGKPNGFIQSADPHYDTNRSNQKGIFLAGCSTAPMNLTSAAVFAESAFAPPSVSASMLPSFI